MRKTRLIGAAIAVLSMLFAIFALTGSARAATVGDGDGDSDDVGSAATVNTSTQAAVPQSNGGGGGLSNVPGVPSSFAACVAFRESTNGTASSNVYGILPISGYNGYALSLAGQKAAFAALYAQLGTRPWAPYDGC